MPEPKKAAVIDDRREWLRIEDCLFLEYRLAGELSCPVSLPQDRAAEELITTFISKPTEDLLATHPHEAESVLVPWLKKIDWVLESMLQRLVRMSKEGIALPQRLDVNISGGGISFTTPRRFQEQDELDLRVILPPFTPIQARVEVTRVTQAASDGSTAGWYTATRFIQITQDDHECLIRHILHVQAEQLRARHARQDAG
jgi:PilZ domain